MIYCLLFFWMIPVAGFFGGSAFKPFQIYSWACAAVLSFFFCLMTPGICTVVQRVSPASWGIYLPFFCFLIGVPLLTVCGWVLIHTFCNIDFCVLKMPRGLNNIVSGFFGFLIGIVLADYILFAVFMSNIFQQLPEKYQRNMRELTLSRSAASVDLVNQMIGNSARTPACRKHLEDLLYARVRNQNTENWHPTANLENFIESTRKRMSTADDPVTPPPPAAAPSPAPEMEFRNSGTGGKTIYGRSINKALQVREQTESRSKNFFKKNGESL
jgi:hypothetical protein